MTGVATRFRPEVAVIAVAGAFFAPNLTRAALVSDRPATLPLYWRNTMTWLREQTPQPFGQAARAGDEYYYTRYSRTSVPPPDYTVMNWWDHGYWVIQLAHRVPVANPTQERAGNAARFYAATTEAEALGRLDTERSRYVIADWELPFRIAADGVVMGRFQTVLDWAGTRHASYYEVFYRRAANAWVPVWVFHEPYYRSMAFRLLVLGGAAAVPNNSTSIVIIHPRVDERGLEFNEVVAQNTYQSYADAVEAAKAPRDPDRAVVVGLDPWRSAFPVEPLTSLHELYASRTSEQRVSESPWVRVFERR